MAKKIVLLGVGNVLEKDDGIGVYATAYLKANYTFDQSVEIINGGVEGINLLDIFMESDEVIILDTLLLEDEPGSIYNIPAHELGGMGLNSGGAHEVGVLQCLDMLALMDKEPPNSNIIGIIPQNITFEMNLSDTLKEKFDLFITTALNELKKKGGNARHNGDTVTLDTIIETVKDPSFQA